jgi:hypothetical protein
VASISLTATDDPVGKIDSSPAPTLEDEDDDEDENDGDRRRLGYQIPFRQR